MPRCLRAVQLAAEGTMNLLIHLSPGETFDQLSEAFDRLLPAGRAWGEAITVPSPWRVAPEAGPSEREAGPGSARLPKSPEPPSRSR